MDECARHGWPNLASTFLRPCPLLTRALCCAWPHHFRCAALTNCSIFENDAGHGDQASHGGGLSCWKANLVTLTYTKFYANTLSGTENSKGSAIYGGFVYAVLPMVLGSYIGSSFVCRPQRCLDRETNVWSICPASEQYCPWTRYEGQTMGLVPNEVNDAYWPPLCAAGYFGGSPDESNQLGPVCEGECPAGHFCPEGSIKPLACPAGSASRAGASTSADCQICAPGSHANATGSTSCAPCPAPRAFQPQPNSTICERCPNGATCSATASFDCPLGSWCRDGVSNPCPAGKLGNRTRRASPECNGECPPGSFCHLAATAAEPCPPGTVGNRSGLQSAAQCAECPAGYWCNSGRQFPCDRGYFTESDLPSSARIDQSACLQCPAHSTTTERARVTRSACMCAPHYYLGVSPHGRRSARRWEDKGSNTSCLGASARIQPTCHAMLVVYRTQQCVFALRG